MASLGVIDTPRSGLSALFGSAGRTTNAAPRAPPLFSTPTRPLQSSIHRPLATNQQDSSTSTSLLPLTRLPPRSDRGSQDAIPSDSDLSDLEEEEEGEDVEEEGFYKSSREQQWSDKEYQALCASFKRHGRSWDTVSKDVEAAEGKRRTVDAVKAAFYRLRSKGMIKEGDHQSAQATETAMPLKRARRFAQGHQWKDEEKRFLLKIGDKHHASSIHNKERAVYEDWLKRYPNSNLTSHVVTGYYYYMKTQRQSKAHRSKTASTSRGRSAGMTSASTRTTRRQQVASSSRRSFAGAPPQEQRLMGLGLTWTAAEIDALEKVHRMGLIKKPDWYSTQTVYEAFRRLLPGTKRTHNAVRNKLINTYYKPSHVDDEEEEEEEEESSASSEGESSDEGGHEQPDAEVTAPTRPSSMDTWQQGVASHLESGPLFASSHAVPQAALQPARISSFPQSHLSTPAPKLSLSFTLTENGIDFEDVPSGASIAVFSPVSFKFLNPQEVAALEHGIGMLSAQQQHEVPAFAFQVLEGGTVRTLRSPNGTTTSVRIVNAPEAATEGGGRSAEGGRMGVETRIVGADFYTLRLITWL